MKALFPPPASAIPLASPWLPPADQILDRFRELLGRRQLTNGVCVEQLEREAAEYLGVPDCVAVSSCTAGLMLVASCLELRGEVILPGFTFFATAHALLWNRLTPVFADCDPETFNLDPKSVARVHTRRASAILAVHVFGCPAPVEELEVFARVHGLRLIFDAAHAFGARVNGKSVAQSGDATVFSLAATKPLVGGEGGLIATADRELARRLRQARNYGNDGSYDCPRLGLNARMSELQAALALAGLPYVGWGIERRRRLAAIYRQALAENPGLDTQRVAGCSGTFNSFPLLISPSAAFSRAQAEQALAARRIETRRYYDPPLHRQKLYRRFFRPAVEPLAVTEAVSSAVLSLPLYADLSPSDAVRIAEILAELTRGTRMTHEAPAAVRVG